MKSNIIMLPPIKTKIYYGWVIVAIAALGLFFSGPGQTYSISMFISVYIKQFGWSRSMISGFYSIATLMAGLLIPFVGRKIDIIGHRKMLFFVPILLAATAVWMGQVTTAWMLFIGFMMLRLLGQGSMTLLSSTLVSKWFVKKRGRAFSAMILGGVIGSAVIPMINNLLLDNMGIQFAWRFWAVLLVGVMVPAAGFFVRNKPENIGLEADGVVTINKEQSTLENEANGDRRDWTLKEAMGTRTFWLLLYCMIIPSMINTGMTFHMVSIVEQKGLTAIFAATLLSLTAIIQLGMNFVAGFLVDRTKPNRLKAMNYWFMVVAILIMIFARSSYVLIFYAVFNAVFNSIESVTTEVLWPSYFGLKYLGSIRSIAMTTMVIGSALGPLPFGFAFDTFNTYTGILVVMMIFPIVGSIACFISPRPIKSSHKL